MAIKGPMFRMMEAMMDHEQFEARMRDEINTRLESWLTISRHGLPDDETYSEENILSNVETFANWLRGECVLLRSI
jgi:hypothetical protein